MGMGARDLAQEHSLFFTNLQAHSYSAAEDSGTVAALLMLIARIDDTNAELMALREQIDKLR